MEALVKISAPDREVPSCCGCDRLDGLPQATHFEVIQASDRARKNHGLTKGASNYDDYMLAVALTVLAGVFIAL